LASDDLRGLLRARNRNLCRPAIVALGQRDDLSPSGEELEPPVSSIYLLIEPIRVYAFG
jgi:hypothetical protein